MLADPAACEVSVSAAERVVEQLGGALEIEVIAAFASDKNSPACFQSLMCGLCRCV